MAKFVGKTLEEIAALPVFPEPEETDGGTVSADGPGYVYFITESGHTSYFKVGKTGNPKTRCMNLQTGNPRKLTMDPHQVANMDTVEKRVLQAMTARYSKTTGGKEWFSGDVAEAYNLFLTIVRT